MSKEDMELVRELNRGFNTSAEGWVELYDPEVEFHMPREWPEESIYRGHEGILRVAELWRQNFSEYRWDEDQLIDAGDCVIGLWHHRGRVKDSGDWIEQRVGTVMYAREGKIVRVLSYFSWEE